jgi:type II secretory pathway pseudopilin PulG
MKFQTTTADCRGSAPAPGAVRRAPRRTLGAESGLAFKIGNRQSAIGNFFAFPGRIAGFLTAEKTVNFGKETVKFLFPRRRAGFPACRFAGLSSPECLPPTGKLPAPAGRINDGGVAACARGGRAPRDPLAPDRGLPLFKIGNRQSAIGNFLAFSLVELLVVMAILSLIVLALMTVFNTTQRAFRASVTQSDVMEGSRATMELITTDLRGLTPSDCSTNSFPLPVNFLALDNDYYPAYYPALSYAPLTQNLPGSSVPRTNLLNYFFMLGRENTKWIGIGYAVNPTNATTLYPLYRFYRDDLSVNSNPGLLYSNFNYLISNGQWTNMSHVMDGVVHLVVRAYDPRGYQMTSTWQYDGPQWVTNFNTQFFASSDREPGFYFYSNTVPAAVEIQLGVLEDRVMRHAESLPFQSAAQNSYLGGQSGHVHLFRQRVAIPNVDPSAYP